MSAPAVVVVKVGGSLLADGVALERIAEALARRRRPGEGLLVVASALHGVTHQLEQAAFRALSGTGESAVMEDEAQLAERHRRLAREVGLPEQDLAPTLAEVAGLLREVALARALPEATYTRLLSAGERLSVPLLAAALRARGIGARALTAEGAGLLAEGPLRDGHCDLAGSAANLDRLRSELLRGAAMPRDGVGEEVLVLTGFYAPDRRGRTVLFGRGGSDYTAGAVAAGLGARALELWKDVPGCLTADPRWVPEARLVPELSFREAEGLAAGGARLLHPRCLKPLEKGGVRVSVRSLASDGPGTLIVPGGQMPEGGRQGGRVVALATHRSRVRLRLSGQPLAEDPLLAREVVRRLQEAGLEVSGGAVSGGGGRGGPSLELTVTDDLPAITAALGRLARRSLATLELRREPAGIHLVGEGVGDRPELARHIAAELSQLGVVGSAVRKEGGGVALGCALEDDDLARAAVGLHTRFLARPEGVAA